jgi:type IV secretory pathway TraG/TraD family ATPase VirD4
MKHSARKPGFFEKISDMYVDVPPAGAQKPYPYGLHEPLLMLRPGVPYTIGDSFEHTMVLGGTGSGKTSAVIPAFERPMLLKGGYGGLICTVKEDDARNFMALAHQTGRLGDVLHIRPGGPYRFNFLNYSLSREGAGAGIVDNAVSVFMECIEARASRRESDSYWTEGVRRLLRHSMETLRAAALNVTVTALKALIDGMPLWNEAGRKAEFPEDSFLAECLGRADAGRTETLHLHNYWLREMGRKGSERQVAGVISTFLNMADPFLSGPVAELFASDEPSNYGPHLARKGALILLDLPVSEWGDTGRTAQILMKKLFIDELLRRQGLPPGEVPCFMLCDEYQMLATPSDAKLMQAGRSSCVAAVCATQNLNNLYAAFDPAKGQHQAHAMLGNFSTLIGCRNHDKTTNEWFADTISKGVVRRQNASTSEGESVQNGANLGWNSGGSGSQQGSSSSYGRSSGLSRSNGTSYTQAGGWSETVEHLVMPQLFTMLASGGPQNHYQVQAVLFKAGKRFPPHSKPFMGLCFRQT